jgi:hypothetical protein
MRLVKATRLSASLMFDGAAVVWIARSDRDHGLALIAQPLCLGALGVARFIIVCAPAASVLG